MSNDITALRTHLFDTLAGLKSGTIDIEKAKTISDVAQTIINTAKVQVDFMRVTGAVSDASGFIPEKEAPEPEKIPSISDSRHTATGTKTVSPVPGGSMTVHRMRG